MGAAVVMPRILIVDDNEDLAFGRRASLEAEGHELVAAYGGRVAIEDAPSGGARFIAELPAAPAHA